MLKYHVAVCDDEKSVSYTHLNLAFDGFFALVITGIAGVDHSGHGKHLSLHVIERWSVLSKHCFV